MEVEKETTRYKERKKKEKECEKGTHTPCSSSLVTAFSPSLSASVVSAEGKGADEGGKNNERIDARKYKIMARYANENRTVLKKTTIMIVVKCTHPGHTSHHASGDTPSQCT